MLPLLLLLAGGGLGSSAVVGGLVYWCKFRRHHRHDGGYSYYGLHDPRGLPAATAIPLELTAAAAAGGGRGHRGNGRDDDLAAAAEDRLLQRLEDGTSYQSLSVAARHDLIHATRRRGRGGGGGGTFGGGRGGGKSPPAAAAGGHGRHGAVGGAWRGGASMARTTLDAGAEARTLTPDRALRMAATFCTNSRVFDAATLCARPVAIRRGVREILRRHEDDAAAAGGHHRRHPGSRPGLRRPAARGVFAFSVRTRWKRRPLLMLLQACPPPAIIPETTTARGPAAAAAAPTSTGGAGRAHAPRRAAHCIHRRAQPLRTRGAGAVDFGQLAQQRACSELLRLAAARAPRFLLRWCSFNFLAGGTAVVRTLPDAQWLRPLADWIPLPGTPAEARAAAAASGQRPNARPTTQLAFHQVVCYGRDMLRGLQALRSLDILHAHLLPEHVVVNSDPALELQLQLPTHAVTRAAGHPRLGVAQLTCVDLNFLPGVGHRYARLLPAPAAPAVVAAARDSAVEEEARGGGGGGGARRHHQSHHDLHGHSHHHPGKAAPPPCCSRELPDIFLFGCCLHEMTLARVLEVPEPGMPFDVAAVAARVAAVFPHTPEPDPPVVDGLGAGGDRPPLAARLTKKPTRQQLADLVSIIAFICDTRRGSLEATRGRRHRRGEDAEDGTQQQPLLLLAPEDLLGHQLFTSLYDPLSSLRGPGARARGGVGGVGGGAVRPAVPVPAPAPAAPARQGGAAGGPPAVGGRDEDAADGDGDEDEEKEVDDDEEEEEEYNIYDDEDDPDSWMRDAAAAASAAAGPPAAAKRSGSGGGNEDEDADAADGGGVEDPLRCMDAQCAELVGRTCSLRLGWAALKDDLRRQQQQQQRRQHAAAAAAARAQRGQHHHQQQHHAFHTRRYRRK